MGCMETPLPQVSREGHAWPVPPCRGLGGPEVHDGTALHLQAEQRDGHEAFPPTTACSRKWRLPPWLVSLPQQGTSGWRGASCPLAFHQPCRSVEREHARVLEKWWGRMRRDAGRDVPWG